MIQSHDDEQIEETRPIICVNASDRPRSMQFLYLDRGWR